MGGGGGGREKGDGESGTSARCGRELGGGRSVGKRPSIAGEMGLRVSIVSMTWPLRSK